MEGTSKQKHFVEAINYIGGLVSQGRKSNHAKYPLSRGDLLVLVKLINQEMEVDPSSLNRLTALRAKLGDLVFEAPEMTREEAKELTEGKWA